jgi:hypothetical protein
MTDTFKRLTDTETLLNQAINSVNSPGIFRANFNAFLASARSVTNVMQHEFKNKKGFQQWYLNKQKLMRENGNLTLFKHLRNESLKERPLVNEIKITTNVNATFQAGQEALIPAFRLDNNANVEFDNNKPIMINGKPSDIIAITQHSYFFRQRPNDDAIELSKLYFKELADIVEECYDKFQVNL